MHPTKKQLNALGIHNEYNLADRAGGLKLYVNYSHRTTWFPAKWQVCRVEHSTDKKARWSDNRSKTFDVYLTGKEKESQRLAALAWASEKYGIAEWERSPFGSYHPLGTMTAVLEAARKPSAAPEHPAKRRGTA